MKIGGKYNWKGQPERLVYIGNNWSGNGYWHQFEKVGEPGKVWCEVRDSELHMIEETATPNEQAHQRGETAPDAENPGCTPSGAADCEAREVEDAED